MLTAGEVALSFQSGDPYSLHLHSLEIKRNEKISPIVSLPPDVCLTLRPLSPWALGSCSDVWAWRDRSPSAARGLWPPAAVCVTLSPLSAPPKQAWHYAGCLNPWGSLGMILVDQSLGKASLGRGNPVCSRASLWLCRFLREELWALDWCQFLLFAPLWVTCFSPAASLSEKGRQGASFQTELL